MPQIILGVLTPIMILDFLEKNLYNRGSPGTPNKETQMKERKTKMKIHTYGIEKTTIRCSVKLPDNIARVQRLYDYGAWFDLHRETMTDPGEIADLIEYIKSNGGKMIDQNEFIDDDDLKEKQTFTFELIC